MKIRFKNRNNILYVGFNNIFKSTHLKDTKINRNIYKNKFHNGELNKLLNIDIVSTFDIPHFNDLLDLILKDFEFSLKPNSYNTYLSYSKKYIYTYFDDILINKITPMFIDSFHKNLLTYNLKKSSFVTIRVILNSVFQNAIINNHISINPILLVKSPKINFSKDKQLPFTLDEIDTLLNNADNELKNFLGISLFSGMRSGEVLALKWSDIDFNNNTIDINSNVTNGFYHTPKTNSSIRTIDMISKCTIYFKNQYNLTSSYNDFVFLMVSNKKRYNSNTYFHYRYKKLLKYLKLKDRKLHNTRHTFASIMLNNNIDVIWVSNMLGHSSIKVTLDTYTHYMPKKDTMKINFLDNRYK